MLGIVIGLALLMFLAYKGYSIIWISLLLPKRYITYFRSPRAAAMRGATSWLFVNLVTLELLPRPVTGGGGQISKTF